MTIIKNLYISNIYNYFHGYSNFIRRDINIFAFITIRICMANS